MDASRALKPTTSEAQVASELSGEPMDVDPPPAPATEAMPVQATQALDGDLQVATPKPTEGPTLEPDSDALVIEAYLQTTELSPDKTLSAGASSDSFSVERQLLVDTAGSESTASELTRPDDMLAESAIAQGSSVAVPAPQPPTAGLNSSAAALDTEVQPLHAESAGPTPTLSAPPMQETSCQALATVHPIEQDTLTNDLHGATEAGDDSAGEAQELVDEEMLIEGAQPGTEGGPDHLEGAEQKHDVTTGESDSAGTLEHGLGGEPRNEEQQAGGEGADEYKAENGRNAEKPRDQGDGNTIGDRGGCKEGVDEDEDADEDEDEEEEEVLEDAEEEEEEIPDDFDVRQELEEALDACQSSHQGAFSAMHKYPSPEACNPCLQIEGFGLLGLPLSVAEAKRLRDVCNQSPFGKGEQSMVDRTVRDTLEIDGRRIQFLNSLYWNGWLGRAVAKACEQLGVTGQQTRCELYKLLLYETGAHFHSHQDTEKAPGMFATLVVILPSLHEGGSVHVKLGQQEKTYETSTQEVSATTVMAWYTDVFHEVKPVTSGYRLALTYNLIFTGDTVAKPRAPASDGPFATLGRVLTLWSKLDELGEGPGRLAYMLSHSYSQVNLSFAHLKGADATLVNALQDLAEPLGFRIALGHLKCTRLGDAEGGGYGGYGGYGRRRGGYRGYWNEYDDDEDMEDEDVEMGEVYETSYSLQMYSGKTGVALGRKEDFDIEELMADEDYFADQDPDDQEYEGYTGNAPGTLQYFYNQTVLLIWPSSQNAGVISSAGGLDAAIAELKVCTSTAPTPTDWDNINVALGSGTSSGARVVADLSARWNDRQLWQRAFKAGKGDSNTSSFGVERVYEALRLFGFPAMVPVVDAIISNTMSTQVRLEFLFSLERLATSQAIPANWILDKRRYILSSIRTPGPADIDSIVAALGHLPDAVVFMHTTLLPQLIALNLDYAWWTSFSRRLQTSAQGGSASLNSWEPPVFNASQLIFLKTIQQSTSNQMRFATLDELGLLWATYPQAMEWISQTRRWAVTNLLPPGPNDAALLVSLLRNDGSFLQTSLLPTLARAPFSEAFWIDLLQHLSSLSKEDPGRLPENWEQLVAETLKGPLHKAVFGLTTNQAMLEMLERIGNPTNDHPILHQLFVTFRSDALRKLKKAGVHEIPILLKVLKDDVTYALASFVPQLKAFGLDFTFWNTLIQQTRTRSAELLRTWDRDQLQKFLGDLVTEAIASTAIKATTTDPAAVPAYHGYGYHRYPYHAQPARPQGTNQAVDTVKTLLTLCLDTNNIHLCALVFSKVFAACTSPDAVQWTIVPLVSVVAELIKGRRLTADVHPFDQFFRECIRVYIVLVLPSKVDANAIAAWTKTIKSPCGCSHCLEVNQVIASSGGRTEATWRAVQYKRTHVEQKLARVPGLRLSTIRSGSPHGLVITKLVGERDPVAPYARRSRIEQAAKLLQAMGPDPVIQRVYASARGRLAAVMDCLRGQAMQPPALGQPEVWSVQPQPALHPVPVASGSGAGPSTAAQAGASTQPTSSIPRKRKKAAAPVNPEDVIEISD